MTTITEEHRTAAVEEAIHGRRTHKTYLSEPVPRPVLDELFELARWAPNHHLSNPWRFRVLGPRSLSAIKALADEEKPGSSRKLDRAPTMIVLSAVQTGDESQDQEDMLASAMAGYIVLLAAHARGLAGYWRTVPLLNGAPARKVLGLGEEETVIGLLHLGHPLHHDPATPDRAPVEGFVSHLG
ncbi:MAG TPA: nitroreductase family protein [Candidatus Dormibacteraeota bacterium]|jgi:nitroreductase|nr:nitroreductase family protein [Candidatus Dormibacteraeota bacterium]